jgi:hypothetical protein
MSYEKDFDLKEIRHQASEATERLDKAITDWSIAWDTYIMLENRPNKTEKEINSTNAAYENMCLAWKNYEKEVLASKDSYSLAFKVASDLYSFVQNKRNS